MKLFKTLTLTVQIVLTFWIFNSSQVSSSELSEKLGLYLPDAQGKCKTYASQYGNLEDLNFNAVCVPLNTWLSAKTDFDKDIIYLGTLELTDPALAKIWLERKIIQGTQNAEAYEVEIESFSGNFFKLTDGSVLENRSSGYVGYIGYHEEAIFFKDGSDWNLCVNNNAHKVEVIRDATSSYNRQSISKTVYEIMEMDICS